MLEEYYKNDVILVEKLIHEIKPHTPEHAMLLLYALLSGNDPRMLEGYMKELIDGIYHVPKEETIQLCRYTGHFKEAFALADAWGLVKTYENYTYCEL